MLLEGVEGLDLIPLMPFELRGENVYDVLSSSDTPLEGGGRCLSLRKKRAAVVVFGLVICGGDESGGDEGGDEGGHDGFEMKRGAVTGGVAGRGES